MLFFWNPIDSLPLELDYNWFRVIIKHFFVFLKACLHLLINMYYSYSILESQIFLLKFNKMHVFLDLGRSGMSISSSRFFKIFLKALCLIVIAISGYFLYIALTLPLTYPILNIFTISFLLVIIIFGIAALLT